GPPSGPGAACGGADFWPGKMLLRNFEIPSLPADCAWDGLTATVWLEHINAAAIAIARVRLVIARSVMPCPSAA
ncbi:MAG TPA: hypothetical protein VIR82_02255, partial [Bradyrhizobium sp.]